MTARRQTLSLPTLGPGVDHNQVRVSGEFGAFVRLVMGG